MYEYWIDSNGVLGNYFKNSIEYHKNESYFLKCCDNNCGNNNDDKDNDSINISHNNDHDHYH